MNLTVLLRNVLKLHRIDTMKREVLAKCSGCPWIGFDHDLHVAQELEKVVEADSAFVKCGMECRGAHFHPVDEAP